MNFLGESVKGISDMIERFTLICYEYAKNNKNLCEKACDYHHGIVSRPEFVSYLHGFIIGNGRYQTRKTSNLVKNAALVALEQCVDYERVCDMMEIDISRIEQKIQGDIACDDMKAQVLPFA